MPAYRVRRLAAMNAEHDKEEEAMFENAGKPPVLGAPRGMPDEEGMTTI